MVSLDSVDIGILRALEVNCRVSYQELSRTMGMSANAVKKRINKLAVKGTIHNFAVYLSHAMANLKSYMAIIETEGTHREKEMLEQIMKNPHVFSAGMISSGPCIVFAQYDRLIESQVFAEFLNGIVGVKAIDIHTEMTSDGSKVEFTPLQIRVLHCLKDDARMPVAEISEKTSLTTRRIRKILTQLIGGGGLRFVARYNLNVDPTVTYYAQIYWNGDKADHNQIARWLDKEFAGQYYDSHISASAPMMLSVFGIDSLKDAEVLSQRICSNPVIKSVRTLFPFPAKKNVRLQRAMFEALLSGDTRGLLPSV